MNLSSHSSKLVLMNSDNLDRHHLCKSKDELLGRDSFFVAFDNGKGLVFQDVTSF